LMVNGSPRNTFRVDRVLGMEAGVFWVVTGAMDTAIGTREGVIIAGVAVVPIPAGVLFVNPPGDIHPGDATRKRTSSIGVSLRITP